ncbi:MAG: hypothetical protein H6747_08005 [Deltaproteobacteria bacterium]|nr:hypothetical protein [Deltaproteobacteria bacterium]
MTNALFFGYHNQMFVEASLGSLSNPSSEVRSLFESMLSNIKIVWMPSPYACGASLNGTSARKLRTSRAFVCASVGALRIGLGWEYVDRIRDAIEAKDISKIKSKDFAALCLTEKRLATLVSGGSVPFMTQGEVDVSKGFTSEQLAKIFMIQHSTACRLHKYLYALAALALSDAGRSLLTELSNSPTPIVMYPFLHEPAVWHVEMDPPKSVKIGGFSSMKALVSLPVRLENESLAAEGVLQSECNVVPKSATLQTTVMGSPKLLTLPYFIICGHELCHVYFTLSPIMLKNVTLAMAQLLNAGSPGGDEADDTTRTKFWNWFILQYANSPPEAQAATLLLKTLLESGQVALAVQDLKNIAVAPQSNVVALATWTAGVSNVVNTSSFLRRLVNTFAEFFICSGGRDLVGTENWLRQAYGLGCRASHYTVDLTGVNMATLEHNEDPNDCVESTYSFKLMKEYAAAGGASPVPPVKSVDPRRLTSQIYNFGGVLLPEWK